MNWTEDISKRDVDTLKSYISVMKPFHVKSDHLGGEKYSTLQDVIPHLRDILNHLMEKKEPGMSEFCTELIRNTKMYFQFCLDPDDLDYEPLYAAATFLDPVQKLCLEENEVVEAKKFIKEQVEMYKKDYNDELEDEDSNQNPEPGPSTEQLIKPLFKHNIFLSSKLYSPRPDPPPKEKKIEDDLEQYETKSFEEIEKFKLNLVKNPDSGKINDPMDFWIRQQKSQKFNTMLPEVAQDLLAIPATSVPSERLFRYCSILFYG